MEVDEMLIDYEYDCFHDKGCNNSLCNEDLIRDIQGLTFIKYFFKFNTLSHVEIKMSNR